MERRGSSDEDTGDASGLEDNQGAPTAREDHTLNAERLHHRVCHLSHLIGTFLHSQPHHTDRESEARLDAIRNDLHQLQRVYNDISNTATATDDRARAILNTLSEQLFRKLPSVLHRLAACENHRRHDKERIKGLQNKVRSYERIMARQEAEMERNASRLSTLELGSYDGKLTWKIDNFKRRREDAISGKEDKLESPHFYPSRDGYKMFARIYLNGDGEGKGTHISIYLIIVKGDFDALLQWPFRHKITFECVDQKDGSVWIESYRPDVTTAAFQRPTSSTNIASGCPLFLPLAELKNPDRDFVENDTMFMKVTVDVPKPN